MTIRTRLYIKLSLFNDFEFFVITQDYSFSGSDVRENAVFLFILQTDKIMLPAIPKT